jgi:hypothetical protein
MALAPIEDDGGGIPEAIRERIFDPFFTTKAVGRGTGQGLAIARSVVVDKHGGTRTFETEVGRGTTFFVRVPLDGPRPPRPGVVPESLHSAARWPARVPRVFFACSTADSPPPFLLD